MKQQSEKLREIELQKAEDKDGGIEEEKRRKRYEEEMALEGAKLEMKRKFERGLEEVKMKSASQCNSAKLPKLVISKFQGTHLDWQRFWGQFEKEIDKAEISPITKLSYLKELLIPKVRAFIDGLPFSTEGYERAKTILKTRYGKESEVANAHMQSIISLPTISGSDARKINRFFETLVANTQALETMGKLNEVKGFARSTLDKLPGIRADLVRSDDNWQDWGFGETVEALRKWCVRNPISEEDRKSDHKGTSHYQQKSGKFLHAKQESWKPRLCVFCESTLHKSVDCDQVVDITSRKKILLEKKLCFNCTGVKHRASECRSKTTCFRCNAKHHTSICDDQGSATKQMMLATGKGRVIYPVVVAVVNGIKCRALLDTRAGSSYISADLVKLLRKQLSRTEYRHIDMMMSSTIQRIEIYDVIVADVRGKFEMKTQNPADLGGRGCLPNNLTESWLNGPDWLPYPDQWPEDIVAQPGKESESEVKLVKNLFAAVVEVKEEVDELLQKHTFWKSVRILGWITRFVNNFRATLGKTRKQSDPLTTTETETQVELLVKKFTERQIETEQFKNDQLRLNLQRNVNGLFECRGRIQGLYPIYVPLATLLSEKMIEDAHVETLHGGVGLTMTRLRQRYWIPRLRQSTKKVIAGCYGCTRFQATAYHNPPVGNLPLDRTVGSIPFEVLGVDYAGPLIYKINKTKDF
ncbi:uncharacterized protein LOC114543407 [Dendronephthya gigantea]|uniref:uncharacterized protein LOC114542744 n=1 Tax=Dendronephthya gigantea TaxID=151771 RepID=UPI00106DC710|nr:uncharacterized protein LOC114542744 [Dendronephthya gigantea]XP_028418131.1 uncharacterized protein LOC114543272 [Dendronephthya gigantea]XP_028418198.1 uncharacterized protein LOC114543407 [Dendronephthya gigantea]